MKTLKSLIAALLRPRRRLPPHPMDMSNRTPLGRWNRRVFGRTPGVVPPKQREWWHYLIAEAN